MDRAERERLRRLARAATPGPWQHRSCNGNNEHYVYAPDARYASLPGNPSPVKVAWMPSDALGGRDYRDARYVAAADPDVMLSLLDTIECLERERDAEIAALRGALQEIAQMGPRRSLVEAREIAAAALAQKQEADHGPR